MSLPYRSHRWLLTAILLGALALRLHELTLQDIWWDEGRNIDVALRPMLQVATAPELDIHPPVYFWLLHIWSRISGVSMALEPVQIAYLSRFVSVWAGVASVALLYGFSLSSAGRNVAVLAAAIGAFSPFWLAESQEARMYTVGFALLMAASLIFVRRLQGQRPDTDPNGHGHVAAASLAGFAVLSALALTTHYNAVFVVVTWYTWWALHATMGVQATRLREMLALVVTGFATLLLIAPVAPIALRQIPGYANPNLTVPSLTEYLWQNWQAYVGGYAFMGEAATGIRTMWLVGVLCVFVVGLGLYAYGSRSRLSAGANPGLSFTIFWLAGGLALYYVAVLDRGAFNVRYSSFVTPALYALLAVAIMGWRRLHDSLPWIATAMLLAGLAFGIRADLYDERFAREDIAGVTKWLREHAGPGDLILVDQKYPFGFYYERYAIEPEQEPEGAEEAPARYLFVDINRIDERLDTWAAEASDVFWVQWYESDTDPRRAVAFLLDKEGERQGEEWFRGYSVDWWRLDPPNRFALAPDMRSATHQFEQAVRTVELSLPGEPHAPGSKLPVVIRWERVPGGSVDRPLKARVALYDGSDARIAQVDNRILNDRHLLAEEWTMEDRPLNVYMLELPQDADPGAYALRLLVYDADTLEPLSVMDEAGNPAGIEPTLGAVEIAKPSD